MSDDSSLGEKAAEASQEVLPPADRLWVQSQAGDVVREVIKKLHQEDDELVRRSDSDSQLLTVENGLRSHIHQPGGFRRHFVAEDSAVPIGEMGPPLVDRFLELGVFQSELLYTRFGLYDPGDADGEEDDEEEGGEQVACRRRDEVADMRRWREETAAALSDRSRAYAEERGKRATVRQTQLSLLKSFVGPGILFLPRAFMNGGLALSNFMMVFTFVLNVHNMRRLVDCTSRERDTYGEIAFASCGIIGRTAVEVSIVLSQLSFCAVYGVFISANFQDLILSLAGCDLLWKFGLTLLVVLQLPVHVPLCWVRRLKYFAPGILFADACIVSGLLIIAGFILQHIFNNGLSPSVVAINVNHWPVMLGTVVFLWEGIGLILPVRASMRDEDQKDFPRILNRTLTGVLLVYCTFATAAYCAFGAGTNSVVLLNLPDSPLVYAVQLMYITAVVFTYPVQFFPAAKIVEIVLFGPPHATKVTLKRKWKKNVTRFFLVSVTLLAARIGASQLDNFVALIGAFCCLPLAVVYPSLFHLLLYRRGSLNSQRSAGLRLPLRHHTTTDRRPTADLSPPPPLQNGVHNSASKDELQAAQSPPHPPLQISQPQVDRRASAGSRLGVFADFRHRFLSPTAGLSASPLSENLLSDEESVDGGATAGRSGWRLWLLPRRREGWLGLEWWQLLDVIVMIMGVVCMLFTSWQAIASWSPKEIATRCESGLVPVLPDVPDPPVVHNVTREVEHQPLDAVVDLLLDLAAR